MLNDIFHALSDPTRRKILRLLKDGDKTAGQLAEHFPLARSTLSGHFNVLKHAGLIVPERDGVSIVYSLSLSAFEEATALVLELRDRRKTKEPNCPLRNGTGSGRSRLEPTK